MFQDFTNFPEELQESGNLEEKSFLWRILTLGGTLQKDGGYDYESLQKRIFTLGGDKYLNFSFVWPYDDSSAVLFS